MKVSVALMAHPKRAGFLPSIAEKLDADPIIVFDEKQDRWDTGRRSMLAHDPAATHHLVVQDDAIICRDLVAGVTEAVEAVPNNPLCLYTGNLQPSQDELRRRLRFAERSGASWMVMEGPWWGVGVVIPVPMIGPMLVWCDRHPEIPNYDRRMARYFNSVNVDCYYTVPSLVDHRQDHHSLVPGRVTKGRHAHQFIGAEASALGRDWTKVAPSGHVRFKSLRKEGRTLTVDAASRRAEQLRRLPQLWVEA